MCVCVCWSHRGTKSDGWVGKKFEDIYIYFYIKNKKNYFNIFLNEIHFKNNFYYNVVIA
jgi:hypothetical protein